MEKDLMRQICESQQPMIKKQIMRSARSADERRFLSMRSIRKKIAAYFPSYVKEGEVVAAFQVAGRVH